MSLEDHADHELSLPDEATGMSRRRVLRGIVKALGLAATSSPLAGCLAARDPYSPELSGPGTIFPEDFKENAGQYGEALDPLLNIPGDLVMTAISAGKTIWNPTGGILLDLATNSQKEREYLKPAGDTLGHLFNAVLHGVDGVFIVAVAGMGSAYLVVRDGGKILYEDIQMRREQNGWVFNDADGQRVAFLDTLSQGSLPEGADVDLHMELGDHYADVDMRGARELMQMRGDISVPQELVLSNEVQEYHNKEAKDFVVFNRNPKARLTDKGLIVQGERFNEQGWFTVAYDFDRTSMFVDTDGTVIARTSTGYLMIDVDGVVLKIRDGQMYNYVNDDLPYVHQNLTTAQK